MNFDGLLAALVAGTGLVALGVGLVTLNSVVTMRLFIKEEIAAALGRLAGQVDENTRDISANRRAIAEHIEENHGHA